MSQHESSSQEHPASCRAAATMAAGSMMTKASWAGSGVAVVAGLNAHELAALGGLAVAVVGLVVGQGISWYYRHAEYKLAKLETEARLRAAQGQGDASPGGRA